MNIYRIVLKVLPVSGLRLRRLRRSVPQAILAQIFNCQGNGLCQRTEMDECQKKVFLFYCCFDVLISSQSYPFLTVLLLVIFQIIWQIAHIYSFSSGQTSSLRRIYVQYLISLLVVVYNILSTVLWPYICTFFNISFICISLHTVMQINHY